MDHGGERLKLSVAIRHHPSRSHLLPGLLERLEGVQVPMDADLSRWGSGRRALLAFDPEASHHMIIEDDAIVPHGLVQAVKAAYEHIPRLCPMGLYLGKPGPDDPYLRDSIAGADSCNVSWIKFSAPMATVGIVFPTEDIPKLVAWGDQDDEWSFDGRIARWYIHSNIECWHTWPSLVDHRQDVPSLGDKRSGRVAARFIGEDASAFDPSRGSYFKAG